MQIQGTTDQLYDMIVRLYNAAFEGTKDFAIQIEILPNTDSGLLNDFISLTQDAINDFGIQVEFEVVENAGV